MSDYVILKEYNNPTKLPKGNRAYVQATNLTGINGTASLSKICKKCKLIKKQ
jgi:hypothetical protein